MFIGLNRSSGFPSRQAYRNFLGDAFFVCEILECKGWQCFQEQDPLFKAEFMDSRSRHWSSGTNNIFVICLWGWVIVLFIIFHLFLLWSLYFKISRVSSALNTWLSYREICHIIINEVLATYFKKANDSESCAVDLCYM